MTWRVTSRLASALAGLILLTGCSQLGAADTGSSGRPGEDLPASVPATFGNTAQWTVDDVVPGSVRVTRFGVLALLGQPQQRSVVLLDPATGDPIWVSRTFETTSTPRMELINQGGHPWVVVWHVIAPDTVRIVSYDVFGPSKGGKPHTHLEDLVGETSVPKIAATSGGVLISGVKDQPPYLFWPADGRRTAYGTGPVLNGVPGVPAAAYNSGFLVTFSPSGFSYASSTGGWPSNTATPPGAVINSGRILKIKSGLMLAAWERTVGGTMIAVHSITSGDVLAQQDVVEQQPIEGLKSSFAVAPDRSWAAWGGYIFNLRVDDPAEERQSSWHDLHGGEPVSIHDGVVYLRGVQQPFVPPTQPEKPAPCNSPDAPESAPESSTSPSGSSSSSGSPSPSSQPCESAGGSAGGTPDARDSAPPTTSPTPSADTSGTPETTPQPDREPTPGVPEHFSGYAALDAATGVLVDQHQQSAPIGISTAGSGIFTTEPENAEDPNALVTLFSVPIGH